MRSISSLFNDSWDFFKSNVWAMVLFVVTPMLVCTLLSALAGDASTGMETLLGLINYILVIFAISGLVYYIDQANEDGGSRPNFKEIWSVMASKWYILFFAVLLQAIFTGVGFVLFFVLGLLFLVWFVFVPFTVVLEQENSWSALWRSREIVKGSWWAVFGRYLVITITSLVLLGSVLAPMVALSLSGVLTSILGSQIAGVLMAIFGALGAIIPIFVTPFVMVFYYNMYQDLK